VAYATHGHHEEHTIIDKIMHHPIFAIIMGIVGILTLIIGIKDYRHHKACETHEHHHEPHHDLPSIREVLTKHQEDLALWFYLKHKKSIDNRIANTNRAYEPSQVEDKNDPMLWKDEYWKWFLTVSKV
jgi:hypothetical protein